MKGEFPEHVAGGLPVAAETRFLSEIVQNISVLL
jgi:hypothetical protein